MLRTDLKDQTDLPYIPQVNGANISATNPEVKIISLSPNDGWGYGFWLEQCPQDDLIPAKTVKIEGTIAGTAFTVVSTTPLAGQIKPYFVDPKKTGWVECNSADNGKTVNVTDYRGLYSLYNAKLMNDASAAINSLLNGSAFRVATYASLPAVNQAAVGPVYSTADTEKRYYCTGLAWVEQVTGGGSGVALTQTFNPASSTSGIATNAPLYVDFNKGLMENTIAAGTVKAYPTATDRTNNTNPVAVTLAKSANYEIAISPATTWVDNASLFLRVFSGLKFIDGSTLAANVDWNVIIGVIAGNLVPTATVQAITSSATPAVVGSILTGHYTYSDTEAEADISTFRWLRAGVAIAGATALTYTVVEADVGQNITLEVTPKDISGTGIPVTSANFNIPVPAPPAILVSPADGKVTVAFTPNATLATETYNAYYTTTGVDPTTASTKLTGVVSPFDIVATNGLTVKVALEMVVNTVPSALSAVVSGVPAVGITDLFNNSVLDPALWTSATALSGTVIEGTSGVTCTVTATAGDVAILRTINSYTKASAVKTITLESHISSIASTQKVCGLELIQYNTPITGWNESIHDQVGIMRTTYLGNNTIELSYFNSAGTKVVSGTVGYVVGTTYRHVLILTATTAELKILDNDGALLLTTGAKTWASDLPANGTGSRGTNPLQWGAGKGFVDVAGAAALVITKYNEV